MTAPPLVDEVQNETLDIYLPLLVPPTSTPNLSVASAVATSIAQMLANSMRTASERQTVTDWKPPLERQREVKTRRGWEKTSSLNGAASFPWVARQLLHLLRERERDTKVSTNN